MGKRPMGIDDLFRLALVGDPQISPDGRRIAFTRTEFDVPGNAYRTAIWLIDTTGGQPRRLTWGKKPDGSPSRDRAPAWSPDGGRLALLSDRGGETQVWMLDLGAGGDARAVSEHAGGVESFAWSPDGRTLAVVARDSKPAPPETDALGLPPPDARYIERLRYKFNGEGIRDGRRKHIYTVPAEGGPLAQRTDGDWDDAAPAWSPDGRLICFAAARGDEADIDWSPDLYVVAAAGGDARRLTTHAGPAGSPAWSPDGRLIAYLGHPDPASRNTCVLAVAPEGGEPLNLTAALDRAVGCSVGSDVRRDGGGHGPVWTPEGILFTATDRGACRIYRASPQGDVAEVRGDATTCVTSFTAAAGRVAYVAGSATDPGDLYVDGERLTRVNEAVLAELALAEPEYVPYHAADGTPIDAWVMRPAAADPAARHPLLLEIHGGPHGAYGWGFFHEFQYLAGLGFGVLYANPRGSQGYGEAFTQGCVGDWGGGDYQDLMTAVDIAVRWPWVDAERLGVTGGSFGGFMTNWVVGHTTRFRAAVTQRSISNQLSFFGTSDIGFHFGFREAGGVDLWEGEETLMRMSPIRYARNVRTPTLIIHSAEDLRCPLEQAEQWYVALRRLGVPTALLRFEGENHELSRSGKPANRAERLRRMGEWFQRYV